MEKRNPAGDLDRLPTEWKRGESRDEVPGRVIKGVVMGIEFIQTTCEGGCVPDPRGLPCPYPQCPRGVYSPRWEVPEAVDCVHYAMRDEIPDWPRIKTHIYRRAWEVVTFETMTVRFLTWKLEV